MVGVSAGAPHARQDDAGVEVPGRGLVLVLMRGGNTGTHDDKQERLPGCSGGCWPGQHLSALDVTMSVATREVSQKTSALHSTKQPGNQGGPWGGCPGLYHPHLVTRPLKAGHRTVFIVDASSGVASADAPPRAWSSKMSLLSLFLQPLVGGSTLCVWQAPETSLLVSGLCDKTRRRHSDLARPRPPCGAC